MNRIRLDDMTSNQLDDLYARLDKAMRALDRAHALTDQWAGDMTTVTRSAAADLFASVVELNGWETGPARPALRALPDTAEETA